MIEPTKADGFVRGDTVRTALLMDELVNEVGAQGFYLLHFLPFSPVTGNGVVGYGDHSDYLHP